MVKGKVITLVRRCKAPAGWRRYPVDFAANGRVIADTVIVNTKREVYPRTFLVT